MLKCYIRCEWFVRNEDAWTLRTWIFNYTLKWTRVVNDVRFTRKILYTRCDRFNGWSYQLPTYSTGAIRKNSFSLSLSLSFYSKFPIIFLSIPLAILFRSCINLRIARIFVQFFSYIYIYIFVYFWMRRITKKNFTNLHSIELKFCNSIYFLIFNITRFQNENFQKISLFFHKSPVARHNFIFRTKIQRFSVFHASFRREKNTLNNDCYEDVSPLGRNARMHRIVRLKIVRFFRPEIRRA